MPFLRVIRDKRGYETTYLMHWYRDGNRQRSKVLYVFRTPGGVRVGRHPLDPDTLREIEGRHPDIDFDWEVVRENQQVIEPSSELRRRRARREGAEAQPSDAPGTPPPAAAPPPRPPIPATIEGQTPDEKVAFLSSLYPSVCERIAQRTSDPARLDTLRALADRLNPAGWTDADQITAGLQQAAEALERLSHVLSKRRRRSRKSRPQRDRTLSGEAVPATDDPDQARAEGTDDLDVTSAVGIAEEPPGTEHQ